MKPGRPEGSGATDRHGPDSRGTGGRSVHGQAFGRTSCGDSGDEMTDRQSQKNSGQQAPDLLKVSGLRVHFHNAAPERYATFTMRHRSGMR